MNLYTLKLLSIECIRDRYFKIALESHDISKEALPGQFLHILVSSDPYPLLRRPFSIHRVRDGRVEILFEVVGKGTRCLRERQVGERLNVIGPLGSGFQMTKGKRPILVGGGIGVAPLLFLAEVHTRMGERPLFFLGGKDKDNLLCKEDLEGLGVDLRLVTEDGSVGRKGLVTEVLEEFLASQDEMSYSISSCGPRGMLREVAMLSHKFGLPCEVSLEERMACGVGACAGCAVKTHLGYKRVCRDGPVFDSRVIVWK
jgi:dihydroorotate dehydrogenase electron transfer subunit